jgi:hypothetical protein
VILVSTPVTTTSPRLAALQSSTTCRMAGYGWRRWWRAGWLRSADDSHQRKQPQGGDRAADDALQHGAAGANTDLIIATRLPKRSPWDEYLAGLRHRVAGQVGDRPAQ